VQHIHALGDISSSFPMVNAVTGGHFNPYVSTHGCWPNPLRHAGDILSPFNVTQTAAPTSVSLQRDLLQLGGDGIASVLGRSFLIHAAPLDNCATGGGDPSYTGAAGKRVAQGVIGLLAAPGYVNVARASPGAVNFTTASATLQATAASGLAAAANGSVQFGAADASGATRVVGSFSGLPPSSSVSVQIHQWADLRSADGSALGARADNSSSDALLTLQTDASGAARFDVQRSGVSLTAAAGSILGRGIALHAQPAAGAQVRRRRH